MGAAVRIHFTHQLRRLAIIGVVGLVMSLMSAFLLAGPASALTPPDGLGVNGYEMFWTMSPATWGTHLTEMKASGIRTVRVDAPWAWVEPSPPDAAGHHYDFSHTDGIALLLAMNGMRWLPIADYSAGWAGSYMVNGKPSQFSPPANFDYYASYVRALVARYGRGGSFWSEHPELTPQPITGIEIWNEPDNKQFWQPAPDPAAYARLYLLARDAAHAVDPDIQAIIGGISPWGPFLAQMYPTLGGPGQIDAVGTHPYADQPSQVTYGVALVRLALDSHGDVNVPIDVTEIGWSTGGGSTVTDAQRGQYLSDTATSLANSDCNVERLTPYAWTTAEANPNNVDDWYGVTSPNGTMHQSATMLANAYHSIAAAPPGQAINPVCARPLTVAVATEPATASSTRARHLHAARTRGHHKAPARGGRRRQAAPTTPIAAVTPVPLGSQKPAPAGVTVNGPAIHGQSSHRACVRAVVRSRATPVAGTVVSFAASAGGHELPAPPPATTDANGLATACLSLPTGRSAVIRATARHRSFLPVPTGALKL